MTYTDTLDKRKAIQSALIRAGFDVGPDGADGDLGPATAMALVAFKASNGFPADAAVDTNTMRALGLLTIQEIPNMIPATATDYLINFITSKINWFAGAMAVAIIAFINTHFGLSIDPTTTAAVTTILVSVLTGGVWLLRTFLNAPKVATKAPEIVTGK